MAVDYIIWLSKHLAPNSISLWWLSIALSIYLLILVTRSIRLKGLDSQSRFDADIQASIQRKVCVEELVSRWVYVIRKYDWEVRLSVGVIWDDPFSLSLPLPLPTRVFNFTLSTPLPSPSLLSLRWANRQPTEARNREVNKAKIYGNKTPCLANALRDSTLVHNPVFSLGQMRAFSMASCWGQLDIGNLMFKHFFFSLILVLWNRCLIWDIGCYLHSRRERLTCHVRMESITISRILVLYILKKW